MFEKQREALKTSKQYQLVKTHVQENRDLYIVAAGCLCVGYTFGSRKSTPITNSTAPVFNNNPTISPVISPVMNNAVNLGGPMHKIVKRQEDGKIWEGVTKTAKEVGAPLPLMSRHLNGHKDDVYGLHYEIIGVSTAG
jgi:hypothetical protein